MSETNRMEAAAKAGQELLAAAEDYLGKAKSVLTPEKASLLEIAMTKCRTDAADGRFAYGSHSHKAFMEIAGRPPVSSTPDMMEKEERFTDALAAFSELRKEKKG